MPVVIILAAGQGERFYASGGTRHKLDALLEGQSVLQHVITAVKASGLGWHLVRPAGGTAGMGASIAMGVRATADAGGWLILPGDLPLIHPRTLQQVADALKTHSIVVPHFHQRHGHPVGFGHEHLPALTSLRADAGAAAIVRTARAEGRVQDLALNDAGIIDDVDTLSDLARARRHFLSRQKRALAEDKP